MSEGGMIGLISGIIGAIGGISAAVIAIMSAFHKNKQEADKTKHEQKKEDENAEITGLKSLVEMYQKDRLRLESQIDEMSKSSARRHEEALEDHADCREDVAIQRGVLEHVYAVAQNLIVIAKSHGESPGELPPMPPMPKSRKERMERQAFEIRTEQHNTALVKVAAPHPLAIPLPPGSGS